MYTCPRKMATICIYNVNTLYFLTAASIFVLLGISVLNTASLESPGASRQCFDLLGKSNAAAQLDIDVIATTGHLEQSVIWGCHAEFLAQESDQQMTLLIPGRLNKSMLSFISRESVSRTLATDTHIDHSNPPPYSQRRTRKPMTSLTISFHIERPKLNGLEKIWKSETKHPFTILTAINIAKPVFYIPQEPQPADASNKIGIAHSWHVPPTQFSR